MNHHCRLCGYKSRPLFGMKILGKYDVQYFRCGVCDLVQSEKPYWLDEAYGEGAMSGFDTGAIARNGRCSQITSVISRLAGFGAAAKCADFGGGHGVFVRMMRDRGMDFHLCDKLADNIFARGFEANVDEQFDVMTSFEVFEHFAMPGDELIKLFSPGHAMILAGTVLHRDVQPGWWYLSPASGQHVAFYSRATMQHIGARFGYRVIAGPAFSAFLRKDVSIPRLRFGTLRRVIHSTLPHRNPRLAMTLDKILPSLTSLTARDNHELIQSAA